MQIIDMTNKYAQQYYVCLEDWSEEMKEAGNHKELWHKKMQNKGLGVKLAVSDDDKVCGMIQYLPIEHSNIEGKDLYFILCIWVHGYKQGVGNHQKKGVGKALLHAAEEDVRGKGAKGIAAWGISLPFWMKASWFKKQGYQKVDKNSMQVLLWKPFSPDAQPPKLIRKKKKPQMIPGKVCVSSFINGWCPAQSIVHERAKRATKEFTEQVVFQEFDTSNPEVFEQWGISDALFVNSKEIRMGPPPSFKKIRRKIARKAKKLN